MVSAPLLHFLYMGGYAKYIWPAYFLVIISLYINIIMARRYFKRALQQLRNRQNAPSA